MRRDNFVCKDCGATGCRLNVHHIKRFSDIIKYNKIKNMKEALSCEELWDTNNGITVCEQCHRKRHGLPVEDSINT